MHYEIIGFQCPAQGAPGSIKVQHYSTTLFGLYLRKSHVMEYFMHNNEWLGVDEHGGLYKPDPQLRQWLTDSFDLSMSELNNMDPVI